MFFVKFITEAKDFCVFFDRSYKFNPGIDLESEEWNKFTDSISKKYEGYEITDNTKFPKYRYRFEYCALDIYFLYSQGTDCWVEYNKENDREMKLNGIFK